MRSLVSKHVRNAFDQFFGKFYYPIIASLALIILLNNIYYINYFVSTNNPWLVADWLINYSDGFVRRGLSGEVLMLLSDVTNLEIKIILQTFLIILSITFFLKILLAVKSLNISFWLLLVFLSPAYISFYIYDPGIIGRKEILLYLSYLFWLSSLSSKKNNFKKTSYFYAFLSILLTLFHEVFFFFSVYFYVSSLIFFNKKNLINHSILIPLFSFFTVLVLYFFNQADFSSIEICNRIISYGVNENVCIDSILSWPTHNVLDSIEYVLSMTNSLSYIYLIFMLVFVHVPFILIYLFEEKIFSKRSFWKVFPIVFVNFFILFLITTDWGRWINVHIIMLGISIIYLFKETKTKEEFAEKNHKKNLLIGVLLPLVLLASMSVWNLRHCCRENFYLMEFNGFVGSILSFL